MNKKQITVGVTGYAGNLGSRLIKMDGCEPLICDITNPREVESELLRVRPDFVLHLAAATNVDWCEKHYEDALSINMRGTAIVCEMSEKVIGAGKVSTISSDHVFDGERGFYSEGDEPSPINNYGLSKLGAESVAKLYGDKIIRISRCFDSKSKDIKDYIDKIECGKDVFVPSHMKKSFAHMDFIADRFYQYGQNFDQMPEILHICSTATPSFYDLIEMIADELQLPMWKISPRGEEPGHTPRPFNAGLNPALSFRLGFEPITLSESVKRYADERA
jgi:dTDP-4-dehydrorhamnose reductase